jgi:hypothetical protein
MPSLELANNGHVAFRAMGRPQSTHLQHRVGQPLDDAVIQDPL